MLKGIWKIRNNLHKVLEAHCVITNSDLLSIH